MSLHGCPLRGWRGGLAAALLFTSLTAATLPALAQTSDDERARMHFQVAASYYEQADYEAALREFQSAFRLSQRAQLYFNISLCYQQLGNLDEAISYLERYLAEVTEIENRASLEQRLGNLRTRRDQQHTTGTDPGETGTETEAGTATGTETGTGTGTGTIAGGDSMNVPAIIGFSIAGVGLIAGAIFSGLTLAEDSRVSALPCAASRSCAGADVSTLDTMALVSDISWGVSLAGAIVGTIFLFVPTGGSPSTTDDGASGRAAASLRIAPILGTVNGLSAAGSF